MEKTFSIVDITSNKEMVVKEKPHTNLTKFYQFDRVFGPKSQQLDVYRAVVEPLIEQVIMMGYNCLRTDRDGEDLHHGGWGDKELGRHQLGQWPRQWKHTRALAQIFDTLREQADSLEYSVRVSFLELYNEEIFDLLSAHDDTSRLRLYEDATRKGSVIIQVGQLPH
jgi:kinesin family protein 11